jgi:hypothetical protein
LFESDANFVQLFSEKNGFLGWNGTLSFSSYEAAKLHVDYQ